jgi:uncharacterized membrane protein
MRYAKLFLTIFPIVIALDAVWILGFALEFYRSQLGSVLADGVIWPAALAFYVFFVIALIVFVLEPALKVKSLKRAVLLGALFGFSAYMTYDLTNLATSAGWSVLVAVMDIAWGTLLTAIVSALSYLIATKVYKY